MKKTFLLLIAALFIVTPRVQAQDESMFFNHLALGVTSGLDGIGAELVVPCTPFLQIRGGYSLDPIPFSAHLNLGTVVLDGETVNLSNVPMNVSFWKGGLGNVMLDIYLNDTGSFHFVAGAFIGSGKFMSATADLTGIMASEDYKRSVNYHGVTCSTDADGYAHADATVMKVMPYVGLGFGRALKADKTVGFSFELGAAYSGGIKLYTYDFSNSSSVKSSQITSSAMVTDSGQQMDKGWVDKLAGLPVLPMMKFGVYVRLF